MKNSYYDSQLLHPHKIIAPGAIIRTNTVYVLVLRSEYKYEIPQGILKAKHVLADFNLQITQTWKEMEFYIEKATLTQWFSSHIGCPIFATY